MNATERETQAWWRVSRYKPSLPSTRRIPFRDAEE